MAKPTNRKTILVPRTGFTLGELRDAALGRGPVDPAAPTPAQD